jgi:aspartate racemase
MSSVGLLGTTATVESEMFQKEFANFGIKTLIPNCDEQGSVTNLIGNVLKTGVVCEKDRQFLRDLINTLENRGAECVLLACTDLQLFVKPDGLKIFDTMDLLAKECVNTLLKLKQK